MTSTSLPAPASCSECGFTTQDMHLLAKHSCDIQEQGGTCEDFPCCGHEAGDCNGQKYGSDEAIKEHAMLHIGCDHEAGIFECEGDEDEDEEDEDEEFPSHPADDPSHMTSDRYGFHVFND